MSDPCFSLSGANSGTITIALLEYILSLDQVFSEPTFLLYSLLSVN